MRSVTFEVEGAEPCTWVPATDESPSPLVLLRLFEVTFCAALIASYCNCMPPAHENGCLLSMSMLESLSELHRLSSIIFSQLRPSNAMAILYYGSLMNSKSIEVRCSWAMSHRTSAIFESSISARHLL